MIISLDFCLPLCGDIKMEFFQRSKLRKVLQFRFWFNTYFLDDATMTVPDNRTNNDCGGEEKTVCLTFAKKDLDIVCKKDKEHKVYKSDFKVKRKRIAACCGKQKQKPFVEFVVDRGGELMRPTKMYLNKGLWKREFLEKKSINVKLIA